VTLPSCQDAEGSVPPSGHPAEQIPMEPQTSSIRPGRRFESCRARHTQCWCPAV